MCSTMRPQQHPELHDERRETPNPATNPRTFSSVRRTGASAELAFPLTQEQAKPSIGAGPVGCGGGSVRWCAARCDPNNTPNYTTNDEKHPTRPPPERAFPSVKRKTRASAELALPPAQEQAKPFGSDCPGFPPGFPSHRSRPNQRFRPGRQAAAVVQPADVLHGAIPPRHPVLDDERRETPNPTTT